MSPAAAVADKTDGARVKEERGGFLNNKITRIPMNALPEESPCTNFNHPKNVFRDTINQLRTTLHDSTADYCGLGKEGMAKEVFSCPWPHAPSSVGGFLTS